MPSPTNAITKLITIFLIIGHDFCYIIVEILFNLGLWSEMVGNTAALTTFSIDISTIDN